MLVEHSVEQSTATVHWWGVCAWHLRAGARAVRLSAARAHGGDGARNTEVAAARGNFTALDVPDAGRAGIISCRNWGRLYER